MVLLLNFAITAVLVGLIWTIQLVHYPLFAAVGEGAWRAYHAGHGRRISWLVVPLMGAELLAALWLVLVPPPGVPAWVPLAAAVPVVVVWGVTMLVAVPLHVRLGHGFDAMALRWLVRVNWVRTVAWTSRGALLGWALSR